MVSYEDATQFERRVAAIFRELECSVEHDVSLAGNQIDVLVSERTPSGSVVRSAIECKYFSRPVGVKVVNSFAGIVDLLKRQGLVDKAIIVSCSGFTRPAREAAKEHSIKLREIEDLERRIRATEIDKYINYMSELLLERNGEAFQRLARARTYDIFPNLDAKAKARALKFIYENGLIDRKSWIIIHPGLISLGLTWEE